MEERTDDERARERLQALGKAIRAFRGDRTQAELGELLGGHPQTTISRWESGLVDLGVTQVRQIEEALELPLGTLGLASGYVGDDLIELSPEVFRFMVFDTFEEALAETAAAAVLNLGFRLYNRMSVPDAYGVRDVEWVLVLSIEPPEAA